jgi:hypothetical protein
MNAGNRKGAREGALRLLRTRAWTSQVPLKAVIFDLDALVKYFREHSPVAPGPHNRITRTG